MTDADYQRILCLLFKRFAIALASGVGLVVVMILMLKVSASMVFLCPLVWPLIKVLQKSVLEICSDDYLNEMRRSRQGSLDQLR